MGTTAWRRPRCLSAYTSPPRETPARVRPSAWNRTLAPTPWRSRTVRRSRTLSPSKTMGRSRNRATSVRSRHRHCRPTMNRQSARRSQIERRRTRRTSPQALPCGLETNKARLPPILPNRVTSPFVSHACGAIPFPTSVQCDARRRRRAQPASGQSMLCSAPCRALTPCSPALRSRRPPKRSGGC
jgi:hypothetical protein